jgi:hypothetical protein
MPLNDDDVNKYRRGPESQPDGKTNMFSPNSRKNVGDDALQRQLRSSAVMCVKSKKTLADGVNISQHAMQIVDQDGDVLFGGLLFLSDEWSRFFSDREHPVTMRVRKLNYDGESTNPRDFYERFKQLFTDFEFKDPEDELRPSSVPSTKSKHDSEVSPQGEVKTSKIPGTGSTTEKETAEPSESVSAQTTQKEESTNE